MSAPEVLAPPTEERAHGRQAGERGRRLARRTIHLSEARILAAASVVGPDEGRGPLGNGFDLITPDDLLGQASWEQAEQQYLRKAVEIAAEKAGTDLKEIDFLIAGDLLNQEVTASFAGRQLDVPLLGLYSACATLAAGLGLAATLVDGGYAQRCMVAVASHHLSAERQYRFPVEFGNQRPPTAQWTATGGAAFVVAREGGGPRVRAATIGRVVDLGVKDPLDMGAAMAPAAADTIAAHLRDCKQEPSAYDLIVTGDLGAVGVPLAERLLLEAGIKLRLADCGLRLYDRRRQDVHAGGSGAACSGLVFAADLFPRLARGELRHVLFAGTGALHSPTTYQQGESVPGICHAVWLTAAEEA